MLPVQWRRFNFFEKDLVRQGDLPHPELKKISASSATSGRQLVILGGGVHFVHPDFHVTSFQAYERAVTLVHQLPHSPILITVGDDDEVIDPTVKIWRVDRVEREANPDCLRVLKITPSKAQIFPVTTMAVTDDLSIIALGLVNGAVHLFFSDKDNVIYDSNVRQRMLVARDVNPVTGLCFGLGTRQLFISTNAYVKCYDPINETTEVLDEKGAELNCVCLSDEGQCVVGRKEAVYFYDAEGHGPCFAFEADKKMLSWVKGYLAVVGKDGEGDMNTFTIYDLKNKLVAYSGAFQNIMCVIPEWGYIFVLCRDGKLYQLDEADMAAKIETLFKKNLYQVAVSLAQTFGVDSATLTDIYKRYGDHLYGKGDFDGAILQYIKTIGNMDASYVIMKFLNAQRINNLTKFLQALHEKREAHPDHTTLLLSCYTKLKDVNQLDKFIAADWEFSAETAISVCRASGYLRQAEEIARKHKEHTWVLKILVDDFNDYNAALEYLTSLEASQTEASLKLYGGPLAQKKPEQVMALLMNIFRKRDEADAKTRPPPQNAPEEFIHVFVKHQEWCIRFLEFLVSQDYNSKLLYNTLIELYLNEEEENPNATKKSNRMSMAPTPKKKEKLSRAYGLLTDPKSNYAVEHALILCEQARFHAGALYLYEKMKLYNEILQYYMLRGDYENVIVTCRRHGDKEPNLWIRSLGYFATADEPCETEIAEILNLARKALRRMRLSFSTDVERESLLSAPQVVQVLSKKPGANIALIRDYVIRKCEGNRQLTVENTKQVKQYVDETERFRAEIDEFRTTMKTINANKCSVCGAPLDPPVIHFLCLHSFHQHCMPESLDNEGPECVICAKANQQLFETRASLQASSLAHDKFFKQLGAAPDGFVTVSEYLGRQIFSSLDPIMLEKDEPSVAKIEEELQIEARRAKRLDPIRAHEGYGVHAAGRR